MSPFRDIEKAIIANLPALLTLPAGCSGIVAKDSTEGASTNVAAGKAQLVVNRVGGGDDLITDYPRMSLEFYAGTRAIAYALCEDARQILLVRPRLGTVIIDRVLASVGPRRLPWDNPGVQRFELEARISLRR